MFDKVKINRLDDFTFEINHKDRKFLIGITDNMVVVSGDSFERVWVNGNHELPIEDAGGITLYFKNGVNNRTPKESPETDEGERQYGETIPQDKK